jgi:hypothetical protein
MPHDDCKHATYSWPWFVVCRTSEALAKCSALFFFVHVHGFKPLEQLMPGIWGQATCWVHLRMAYSSLMVCLSRQWPIADFTVSSRP